MSKRKCLAVACSLALVLAVLAGCEQDEIRRYQVPREESPKPHASSRKPQAERMLAAIVPRDDQTWFIKLAGPK
ncbi:MAG: hypothetical protein HY000_19035, partial [Planctomycetes bacterium]|nr:hypothetical protein [Planctomycetota bacterium]